MGARIDGNNSFFICQIYFRTCCVFPCKSPNHLYLFIFVFAHVTTVFRLCLVAMRCRRNDGCDRRRGKWPRRFLVVVAVSGPPRNAGNQTNRSAGLCNIQSTRAFLFAVVVVVSAFFGFLPRCLASAWHYPRTFTRLSLRPVALCTRLSSARLHRHSSRRVCSVRRRCGERQDDAAAGAVGRNADHGFNFIIYIFFIFYVIATSVFGRKGRLGTGQTRE